MSPALQLSGGSVPLLLAPLCAAEGAPPDSPPAALGASAPSAPIAEAAAPPVPAPVPDSVPGPAENEPVVAAAPRPSPSPPPPPLLGEALWESAKARLQADGWPVGGGAAGETLVILDWDDTLCPTTALTAQGHFAPPSPNPEQRAAADRLLQLLLWACRGELTACASAAAKVLKAAREIGRVLIVTNAVFGWVQGTAERFLPELVPELVGVPVISARSIFEPQGITDPARWKALLFQRLAQCFQLGANGAGHLISIGDSWHERAAILEVAQNASPTCYVKSLKLLERPSISQIGQELEVVCKYVPFLASHTGLLDLCVRDTMTIGPLVLEYEVATPAPDPAKAAAEEEEASAKPEVQDLDLDLDAEVVSNEGEGAAAAGGAADPDVTIVDEDATMQDVTMCPAEEAPCDTDGSAPEQGCENAPHEELEDLPDASETPGAASSGGPIAPVPTAPAVVVPPRRPAAAFRRVGGAGPASSGFVPKGHWPSGPGAAPQRYAHGTKAPPRGAWVSTLAAPGGRSQGADPRGRRWQPQGNNQHLARKQPWMKPGRSWTSTKKAPWQLKDSARVWWDRPARLPANGHLPKRPGAVWSVCVM